MALRPSNDHTIPYWGRFTVLTDAFEAYAGEPGTVEKPVFCRVVVEPSAPVNGAISECRKSPILRVPAPSLISWEMGARRTSGISPTRPARSASGPPSLPPY